MKPRSVIDGYQSLLQICCLQLQGTGVSSVTAPNMSQYLEIQLKKNLNVLNTIPSLDDCLLGCYTV